MVQIHSPRPLQIIPLIGLSSLLSIAWQRRFCITSITTEPKAHTFGPFLTVFNVVSQLCCVPVGEVLRVAQP